MSDLNNDDEHSYRIVHVVPSARRLLDSIRNMRYDFSRAVADLVDNSIQAGATKIDIHMFFISGQDSRVLIADNGRGMSQEELTEAMRLGTRRDYEKGELGRFGMGLKTASLSQCRNITVASRSSVPGSEISVRSLDLNLIDRTDSWVIKDIPVDHAPSEVVRPLQNSQGTVVLWEQLDRLMKYKISTGASAVRAFNRMAAELEKHLSAVFHRFLSGEATRGRVEITLNDRRIEPWDPFATSERSTTKLDEVVIEVQGQQRKYSVKYSSFILPNQDSYSTPEAFDYYGRGRWNELQGFYIYREDRLIQYGGWNGMRVPDEHTKFARVALYFTSDADDALDMDIRKTNIELPDNLKESLRPIVANVTSTANKLYRIHGPSPQAGRSRSVGSGMEESRANGSSGRRSWQTGDTHHGLRDQGSDWAHSSSSVTERPSSSVQGFDILDALRSSARATGDHAALDRILLHLKSTRPDIAGILCL
ncbi:ATP-binding protein [Caldiplasma sukawensis]